MKTFSKIIFILILQLYDYQLFAQINSGAYRGNLVEEQVYSRTQDAYISVDKIYMTTKIIFTKTHIYFKKGESNWLINSWTFEGEKKFSNGKKYDAYHDERNQQIFINYEDSEILYYHNWDTHTNNYGNVSIYKGLKKDESILEEFETKDAENNKFRIDYTDVAIYDPDTKKWREWEKGFNTFVININSNGDIMHIKPNGEKIIYRTLSGAETDKTSSGEKYQIIKALDKDGNSFKFQLFDDESIGLKMIYGNVMIQFAK